MSIKNQIITDRLPRHVAIIMDGNGRWAKKQGKLRMFGHQHGVAAVRDTVGRGCAACDERGDPVRQHRIRGVGSRGVDVADCRDRAAPPDDARA